ncbi:DUF4282 domain-containing protein [Actinoallomurus rhizosphaericola]|uniref:DUF4282 domain-containing protein n=1 Tax=Actinoallomurus rhizosphaericola TaxID=2952536 RepID=UPI002090B7D1|nr:DUF4282 domain-containing protein [Actinoallomurus rhizosphaericola]MCO5992647.1 DUF4282 domain-containing protein [Actinoallomurus rhizosphaericola]
MSNAPDDPGHRPPPPRQGDAQPYQGDAQPYQGDPYPYQGDPQPHLGGPPYGGGYAPPSPNQPPPPTAPWQGPPPGYGPPPHGPLGPPTYAPRPTGKGFFGALFDANFDYMVTTRLIKVTYALAIVVYSLVALLLLLLAWSFFYWNKPLGFITLIAAPIFWISGLLTTRIVLEFVINQFKISEHLKAIREQGETR